MGVTANCPSADKIVDHVLGPPDGRIDRSVEFPVAYFDKSVATLKVRMMRCKRRYNKHVTYHFIMRQLLMLDINLYYCKKY